MESTLRSMAHLNEGLNPPPNLDVKWLGGEIRGKRRAKACTSAHGLCIRRDVGMGQKGGSHQIAEGRRMHKTSARVHIHI
jgi:hypothetical protein